MTARFTAIAVLALLLGTPLASAQEVPSATQLAERMQLTEETAEAVHRALTGREAEPGFLWAAAAELAGTLTDAQKRELLASWPGDRRQALQGQRPARQVQDVMASLSPDQRSQIQEIRSRYAPEMRDLTRQMRDGSIDREAAAARRSELRHEMAAEIQQVVPDQVRREARQGRATEQRRAQHLDRGEAIERREQMMEARAAALGLTARQQEQMQSRGQEMRQRAAQMQRERGERRQRLQRDRGERQVRQHRGEARMAEVLTPQQREIVQIRRALAIGVSAR